MKPAVSQERHGLKTAAPAPGIAGLAFRYGSAVGLVAVAAAAAVLTWHFGILHWQASLFLFAIAVDAWYSGLGPTIVAVVFSAFTCSYFFTAPLHDFILGHEDLPHLVTLHLVCAAGWLVYFGSSLGRKAASTIPRRIGDYMAYRIFADLPRRFYDVATSVQ
jgi:K+-sensing histidine kinase KdpD